MHHAQPGVLEHLVDLRRQAAAEQAPDKAVQRLLVPRIELVEGPRVAARKGGHQSVVVAIVVGAGCALVHRPVGAEIGRAHV